jgi:hypothetical protein
MEAAKRESRSQSEILKHFLRMIVFDADLSESGSIVEYKKSDNKLVLFNKDNFLFEEGYLEGKKEDWTSEFALHEGLAGRAFDTGETKYSNDVTKEKWYLDKGEPISSMVCAPIKLPSHRFKDNKPFGVASFHNKPAARLQDTRTFSPETIAAINVAVNILSFALDLAGTLPSASVFIVHGRDTEALKVLQEILTERGVKPITVGEEVGTGQVILEQFESLLNECGAGFVLWTPDDEGRFKLDPPSFNPRARQNVVFEAGFLAALFRERKRISFLKTGHLELPSDIGGLKWEEFDPNSPNLKRIEAILSQWGIEWTAPAKAQ